MDDWASFEAEPNYDAANIAAVGMYTSDALTDGDVPVGMENADKLAETMESYREILNQATADLWKRIASWSREQMIDAGALVYRRSAKDFAHLAGTYRAGRLVPDRRLRPALQAADERLDARQPRRDGRAARASRTRRPTSTRWPATRG